jgi:exosortase/archaeosortase family protein
MPKHASDLLHALKPYRNILIFVVAMLAADAFWKLTVRGDEGSDTVFFLKFNLTQLFDLLASHTARCVYLLLHPFKPDLTLSPSLTLAFSNHHATHIAWSCTPLKQIFIFTATVLAAPPYMLSLPKSALRGTPLAMSALHKLWFVPVMALLVYAVNILRIAAIVLVIEHHPELFTLFHTYLLKYAFYAVIFLLYLLFLRIAQS